MKPDSRSADAFAQFDLVVSNAGFPTVASPMPWDKQRPAAARAAAMLAFAAGLLIAAIGARAADERARLEPSAEQVGPDSVHVKPVDQHCAPPKQPDVSAADARCVDALYRLLMGPEPAHSSDAHVRAPGLRAIVE
jgi:hypothetical protein